MENAKSIRWLRTKNDHIFFFVILTNCDFETAILHYIDGWLEENIFRIGRSREATEPNTENIFSSNAVNIMQNCRLKIPISFVSRCNRFSGKTKAKLSIFRTD